MNSDLNRMSPFYVMDVLDRAKAMEAKGEDIVHLEVGEPDFDLHPLIEEAVRRAYAEKRTHYTDSAGDAELRDAVCRLYKAEYGVDVTPDRVIVTSGSSPALMMGVMAVCDAGEEVLVSNPGYPCYRNFALAAHAVPVDVPVSAENGFQLDPADVEKATNPLLTRAVFVNSPMNPAGTMTDPDVLRRLADGPLTVLSDEIYHGLVYNGKKAHSILEFTDNAFVFNGFSKRFAMTGLRLGYMIVPKKYVKLLRIVNQNLFLCAGSTAQRAGLAAIQLLLGEVKGSADFIAAQQAMVAEYDRRRRFILEKIRGMGMKVQVEPEGAFYVFADARCYTNDSLKFAYDVLERAHVGITPGTDFGTRGQGFVRFAYANSIPRIREAFNRMAEF